MDGNISKCVKAAAFVCVLIIFVYGATLIREMVSDNEFNVALEDALKGNADAQLRVAMLYDQVRYTKTSRNSARHWFEKAARNGSETAKYMLCINYRIGCDL